MYDQQIEIPVINISAKTGLVNIEDDVSNKSRTSNRSNISIRQDTDLNSTVNLIEPVQKSDTSFSKPEEPPEKLIEQSEIVEIQQAPELSEDNLENSFRTPEPLPEVACDSAKPPGEETHENLQETASISAESFAGHLEEKASSSPKPEEITQELPEGQLVIVSQPTTPAVFQIADPAELIGYRPLYRTQLIWAFVNMFIFLPLLIWLPGLMTAMYAKKHYRFNEFIRAKKYVRRTKFLNIFALLTGKF